VIEHDFDMVAGHGESGTYVPQEFPGYTHVTLRIPSIAEAERALSVFPAGRAH
jgi:hypothetical protein